MDKIKNTRQKGRPLLLTEDVENAITQVYEKHPDWSAQRILNRISYFWFNHLKQKHPDWTDQQIKAQIKLPGVNSVQKYIHRFLKPNRGKLSPLDQAWHIGLMDKYKIIPEAIPFIMAIQDYVDKSPDDFPTNDRTVSIRQARWISKLHRCTPQNLDKIKDKKRRLFELLKYLWQWSVVYADYERMREKAGDNNPDTRVLDAALRAGNLPITANAADEEYPSFIAFWKDIKPEEITITRTKGKVKQEITEHWETTENE